MNTSFFGQNQSLTVGGDIFEIIVQGYLEDEGFFC